MYKYLGVFFSTRLSFNYALEDLASRAKKATILILKTLWSLDEHSPSIFFKLFDCQVQPILSYGSEVWAVLANLQIIEKIHLFALKRFLCISSRTPKHIVYGESGRYPLFINLYCRALKYWLKLTRCDNNRFPKKAYNTLLDLHFRNLRTWATEICYILYRYGFGEVWESQGVGDIKLFMSEFKARLIENYQAEWREKVMSKESYMFYSSFKQSLTVSDYLLHGIHVRTRSTLARLRCGMLALNCRSLPFIDTSVSNTSVCCPYCEDSVENEVHFVLVCPLYDELREIYIPKKYVRNPSLFRLSLLLSCPSPTVITNLTMFVYRAFNTRSLFLEYNT